MNYPSIPETWEIKKPAVSSKGGIVVSQHKTASEIGAAVLGDGGNAVDAAVATGLAIGCVEPWMSGIGGVGQMLVYRAGQQDCHAIDFGAKAPLAINPADYALTGDSGSDLFAWPAVVENRNVLGPYSVAVPSYVAGVAKALAQFGSMPWRDVLQPAVDLARKGLSVDWFATVKITAAARDLCKFDESRRVFLPDGFAPVGDWAGDPPLIQLGALEQTLSQLWEQGPDDFYHGELAQTFVQDAQAAGMNLSAIDLSGYAASSERVRAAAYRNAKVFAAPKLTAGPTLLHTLQLLEQKLAANHSSKPDAGYYVALVEAMQQAYVHRLAELGDTANNAGNNAGDDDNSNRTPSTTHINVIDKHGNSVSLTQTLLSVFGSRVMLPQTGLLMNNGMMWFDPRPGLPNSIAPGKRPLSNMCPTIARLPDGRTAAFGASGGRRIMAAVLQQFNLLHDFGLSVDEVAHHPRIDVSGTDVVSADAALSNEIRTALAQRFNLKEDVRRVYPNLFACPNLACYFSDENAASKTEAAGFLMSPWAAAVAENI